MSIEQKAERVAIEQRAQRLWEREGGHCVSHLVNIMADNGGGPKGALGELIEQAFELALPIDDWEEAATQEGWTLRYHQQDEPYFAHTDHEEFPSDDWQELCEEFDIEPYQREVFEHWIVSDWLADKLAAKGEKVDKDFAGLTIWARTTSGQATYSDYVMEAIAADILAERGEA